MNFDGRFACIGKLDPKLLQERVSALTETDWAENAWRQKTFKQHRDTQSIHLLFDSDFRHLNPTKREKYAAFADALAEPFAKIARHYGEEGYFIRILLARLRPGGRIPGHRDGGYSLLHSHRVHIPIFTQPEVTFVIDGEQKHLGEGELWEINNSLVHATVNNGPSPRVHIILDWAVPIRSMSEQLSYWAERSQALVAKLTKRSLQYD
jgi:quercetin dioxygenase-like cupin family protein